MSWFDRLLGRQSLADKVTTLETNLATMSDQLKEASALAQMYDPDLGLTAAQGGSAYMRRLTQASRDFTPLQHAKALKLAFWLYETNPIARRILTTTAAYIIGDGFKAASEYTEESMDEEVQEAIDTFWNDHINLMDLKLPGYALELGMWGELCLSVNVNPVDGLVRLASVDPERIKEIVMDKTDVVAISLTAETSTKEERLKLIRLDEDPNSKSFGLMIGATADANGEIIETWQDVDSKGNPKGDPQKYLGSCFFFRVNNVSNARRGRSDLLAVMDWLDAYDQELFGEIERAQLQKNFIWDVELTGFTEQQIVEWLKKNGSPKPGALRAHNESAKWNAVTPDLKIRDAQQLADMILGHIATGAQYPKTWLNVTDTVNRATGQVLDEPTFRWMTARQRFLRYIVEQIVTFQLDQRELAGKLTRKKAKGSVHPESWNVQINAPELRTRDLTTGANSLAAATQGLVNMFAEHFIDLETAQKCAVLLVEQLGIEVDLDEMQQNIAKALEEEEASSLPPVVPTVVKPGPAQVKPVVQNTVPTPPAVVAPTLQQRNQKGIAV